jgi:hypothetical protein
MWMFFLARTILFGLLLLTGSLSARQTHAAAGDNIGINASRRISEAIENSVQVLSRMQERFGVDLSNSIKSLREIEQDSFEKIDKISRDRVDQIGKVADETVTKIGNVINSSLDRVNNLVNCAPQVMTKAVEESLSNLKIWGLVINFKTRDDLSPANQYFSARDEILKSLKGIQSTQRAESVIAAYGEISRLAVLTQCHYVCR